MPRPLRWLLRIVLGFVLVVALLLLLMTTPWFKDLLRRQLVTRSAAAIDGDLQIGSLTGTLWYDVTLRDVAVRQNGRPVVQIGSISAHYDPVQLLAGRIALDSLAIDAPVVHAVQGRDGWNVTSIVRTRATGPSSAPRTFAIRRFTVTNGELFVQPLNGAARHATGVALDGGLTYAASGLKATVTNAAARDADTGVPLQLSGNVETSQRGVNLEALDLTAGRSHLTGRVAYSSGSAPAVHAALEVRPIALQEFAAYLPDQAPKTLVVSGSIQADGPLDAVTAAWALDTSAGAIRGRATLPVRAGMTVIPVQASLTVNRFDPAAATGVRSLAGHLTGTATFDGRLDTSDAVNSSARFALDLERSSWFGYEVHALNTKGTLQDGVLHAAGRAAAYNATATFDGNVRHLGAGQTPSGTLTGLVRGVNLSTLPAQVHAPALSTDLSGGYTVAFGRDRLHAMLAADDSRVEGASIAAGTVATADLRGERLDVQLHGRVDDVSGDLLHVPASRGQTTVGGPIDASLTVADLRQPLGLENLAGQVTTSLDGSVLAGETLDRASIAASLASGQLEVRQLDIRSKSVTVGATGVVAVSSEAEGESDLRYTIDSDDLSALPGVSTADLKGLAHVEGRIQGPFNRLSMTGTFSAQELDYPKVINALTMKGTVEGVLPDLDLSRLTGGATVESSLLTVEGQAIRHLTLKSSYTQGRVDVVTRIEQKDRALDLDGSLVLQPKAQEIHVRQFVLAGTGPAWRLSPDHEAVVDYGADRVSIQGLALERGAERMEVSGRIARTEAAADPEAAMTVQLAGVQVGDLYGLLLGPPRVTGTANGSLKLSGSLARPELDATVSVVNGQVVNVAYSDVSATVHLRDKRLTVDAGVREPAGAEFTITGEAPTSADAGPIDLHVVGTGVSLGLAQALTTAVQQVQGQASMDLHVGGTLAAPSLTGQVAIANGGALVTPTGVTYSQLTADIGFDGRRAIVRQFRMLDNDGKALTMTGGADVFVNGSAARTLNVQVHTDELHVLRNDLGVLELTADLRADGDFTAPRVSGRVEVTRGVLEADEWLRQLTAGTAAPATPSPDAAETAAGGTTAAPGAAAATAAGPNNAIASPGPTATAAAATPEEAPAGPAPETGLFSRASMAVDLVLPDNLVLRGRDLRTAAGSMGLGNLNLTIGGNLRIEKQPGQTPEVVGALQAVRGFYDFQGRRFQIVRGSAVSFRGTDPTNPELSINGEREISGVIAQVQVTGTPRRPVLKLSSRPPLDEGDVLSLIVFNQSMTDLGEGDQVDLLQRASDMAVSAVATPLAESIGRALDVDLFEIRTPTAGQAGEVNVGRQVNERLFVGFRQQFGASDASRLSFEYRLTNALRVMTSVAQGSDRTRQSSDRDQTGVDFVYVLRY